MYERAGTSGLFAWPRLAVVGARRNSLGNVDDALLAELGREIELVRVSQRPGIGASRRDLVTAARSGCEALLVMDARFASAAIAVRRKTGVPVAAVIGASDLGGEGIAGNHGPCHHHLPRQLTNRG